MEINNELSPFPKPYIFESQSKIEMCQNKIFSDSHETLQLALENTTSRPCQGPTKSMKVGAKGSP